MARRVLILGGTSEARQAASALLAAGHEVITSLAGVTRQPLLPDGRVRSGGFGGTDGLAAFLAGEDLDVVVDATHPFAAQISLHADLACKRTGVALLRLERPAWTSPADGYWQAVPDFASAIAAVPDGARVLMTTGRKQLDSLAQRPGLTGLVRSIEPPEVPLPQGWALLLARPPHGLSDEMALMQAEGITHLLTKNAGGEATAAKIKAANRLGVRVLMIERPAKPPCRSFAHVADVVKAVGSPALTG